MFRQPENIMKTQCPRPQLSTEGMHKNERWLNSNYTDFLLVTLHSMNLHLSEGLSQCLTTHYSYSQITLCQLTHNVITMHSPAFVPVLTCFYLIYTGGGSILPSNLGFFTSVNLFFSVSYEAVLKNCLAKLGTYF